MEGQLRAKPIECRDDGVVWQMPDGSIKLEPYVSAEEKPEPKEKLPSAQAPVRKGSIVHAALGLLEKHGALSTMQLVGCTGYHRAAMLNALKNAESIGDVVSRLTSGSRIWRITSQGQERFADRGVEKVHAQSSRVVLKLVGRAHGPVDTMTLIERAADFGVTKKTVKWCLASLRDKRKLLKSEQRTIPCGPMKKRKPVCFWSLTKAGRTSYEWMKKTDREAA